jgi:hypothetical protein
LYAATALLGSGLKAGFEDALDEFCFCGEVACCFEFSGSAETASERQNAAATEIRVSRRLLRIRASILQE